ncbi:DUF4265 domain-containing protein [Actinomadura fulvescens]
MPEKRPPGKFLVAFDLQPISETWPPFSTERIWARKGTGPYQLVLENIPFFVRGLACGDVIRAKPDHERRELVFAGVVAHGGNSTIRLILRNGEESFQSRVLAILAEAGCEWEFSSVKSHLAVNIAPQADYMSLRSTLVSLIETGDLEVEEAYIAENHRPA